MAPAGYPEPESLISIYPILFKAFHGDPNDDIRRFNESVNLSADIAALPAGRHAIVGADFNLQRSSDPSYIQMVGEPYNTGVLRDPINRGGDWNNNIVYRNIHTQDSNNSSGMDDRFDQVLLSPSLVDAQGMDYISDYPRPWDLRFFEDSNHSYRAWGNDGSSFNGFLNIATNAMVGPVIAQAIVDMALDGGHIPVFLDLAMPGRLGIDQPVIDLGNVPFTDAHAFTVDIRNAGDTSLWGETGINPVSTTSPRAPPSRPRPAPSKPTQASPPTPTPSPSTPPPGPAAASSPSPCSSPATTPPAPTHSCRSASPSPAAPPPTWRPPSASSPSSMWPRTSTATTRAMLPPTSPNPSARSRSST
ncbi:MAG: hypothetical protein D6692_06690 [Planctomycetota bacterium]|nr:MAG: hypothetical protein D6692_06690 [Planctomycetota bacterium]